MASLILTGALELGTMQSCYCGETRELGHAMCGDHIEPGTTNEGRTLGRSFQRLPGTGPAWEAFRASTCGLPASMAGVPVQQCNGESQGDESIVSGCSRR